MNAWRISVGSILALAACQALAGPPDDSQLAALVGQYAKLHRVTEKPHQMQDTTALLCDAPRVRPPQSPHEAAILPAYCHVYVNESAKEPITKGEKDYPVGSLLVKSKLHLPDSKEPELFTVMLKREAGYNAEHGDWEYAVLEGHSFRVLARGRIESCIDCHQAYQKTGYVTRTYLDK